MAIKIMYLIDEYDGPVGGTEGQLLQIIRHLDRDRYKPAITVLRRSAYIERHQFPCELTVLNIAKILSLESIIKFARYALNLRRENYRLVHCFFSDSSMIAPLVFKLMGIPVVISRRDMGFWYTFWNLSWLRVLVPLVDCYVANSRAVKRIVQQREWVPEHKVAVIYNGYSPDDIEGCGILPTGHLPKGVPIIGLAANLRPIKRADILIRAFSMISERHPDTRLVLVGSHHNPSPRGCSMLEYLQALAGRLGVLERVIFIGSVDNAEPYISQFTVGVLCSESEGFSNSLIEYMQAGLPVICTDTGGNGELIEDGINGFLVPVGDVDRLADRLVKVLSDSAMARRLGEAARDTARSYSVSRMIDEQMTCYDEVLSAYRSSGEVESASSAN